MQRSTLAQQLVTAKNAAERNRLLNAHPALADEKLAVLIKDICYAAWTSAPARARRAAEALRALSRVNPGTGIQALMLWVSGIADVTRGRLEAAIDRLDRAAGIFQGLDREHDSAQTRVAKLIALALLGRYEEAVETGEKARAVFIKNGDEQAAGKIEKNLGNILSRQDRHRKAEKFYRSAIKRFTKTGDKDELVSAENGLAITYTHLNDFRQAEQSFTAALETSRAGDLRMLEAGIEASIGNLALFRGRYDEALKYLELSRRKYEELDMPHQTAVAELEIADIYRELNLTREAFDIYQELTGKLSKLKLQGEEARARASFGRAAIVLGEAAVARRELKRSARLYERENNKTGAAAVKLVEARLEIARGNTEKASDVLAEAEKFLKESDSARYELPLRLLKAELSGDEDELRSLFDESRRQEQPHFALAALNLMGRAARSRGDIPGAKAWYRKAAALIERLRAPLAAEEFRMSFLANKLEPFENLASIYLEESRFREAFAWTERGRSRSLAESVGDGTGNPDDAGPPELIAKLADMREALNWYYSRIARGSDEDTAGLQQEVRKREKQIGALMRQIESTRKGFPQMGTVVPDVRSLQRQLGRSSVLVEFINVDGRFSAFVIDDKKVHFARDLATTDEILALLEGLQFQFGALRYGTKLPEKFAAGLKTRADAYLNELYRKLLGPLEKLTGGKNLVIVPAGALHYVPFQALFDGGKYVIETREVVYAPSASVWLSLREKPGGSVKNSLLLGYADERIPLVDKEIQILEKVLPGPKSYRGRKATFAAYTANAPDFDLLHLACHGQFRPDNPMFSSLHLADGWITVRDICRQPLRARLVTLSACETGLNKIFAGDELIGLTRGFLAAGAASLVVSLWTVNDEAAAQLMQTFYEKLQRGGTVAASLRVAQCEFIRRGAHPYFWSPFIVTGR